MPNIFRKGRPTNFKLGVQTEHEDSHQLQAPWPPRSEDKVAKSRDVSDRCWPISRERNVLETTKLSGRLSTSRAIMHTSFKVKGQRSRSPGRLMLIPEVRNIFRTGRLTNFELGTETERVDWKCRTGKWWTKCQGLKMQDRKMTNKLYICCKIKQQRTIRLNYFM